MPGGIGYLALRGALAATQEPRLRRLLRSAEAPEKAQAALLRRILETNAGTAFGAEHRFEAIRTVADYRKAVPVQTYEDLRHHVERQELTGEPCLTAEQPVFYNRTSGTGGTPKNIPVTPSGLKRLKAHQRLATHVWSKGAPILSGKVFAVGGAAVEGHMPGGTPYGSASGKLHENQPRPLKRRYTLPTSLTAVADYEARYLIMAVLGLADPAVTCVATANPSTLTRLLAVIGQHPETILAAVADGRLPRCLTVLLDPDEGTPMEPRPGRAAQLGERLESTGRLTYADIWPNLAGVVTWTGGSCAVAAANLKPSLPESCLVIEVGWVASEMQGTTNVDAASNTCLPVLGDTFFEFAERDAWDAGDPEMLSPRELETGRDYNVVVTTADGLYRYDMSDIVRVTGWVGATPTLVFVQKGSGITSITGEKLHEGQVLDAVCGVLAERSVATGFFIMLADVDTAAYTLYLEEDAAGGRRLDGTQPRLALEAEVDTRLRAANIEYDAKRASGRLQPPTLRCLRVGTGAEYRRRQVAAGQRDVQFKYLHVQYRHDCAFDFDAFAEPD